MTLRQRWLWLLWRLGKKDYVKKCLLKDMKAFVRCERYIALDVPIHGDFEWNMAKALIQACAGVTLSLFHDDVRRIMQREARY